MLVHGRLIPQRRVLRVRVIGEAGRERVEQRRGLGSSQDILSAYFILPDCHILCVCHYTQRMSHVKSRREMYSEATRAALLDEATTLFAARGYASTSLEDIASASQVTRGAVYHHFASKRALFEAESSGQEAGGIVRRGRVGE